MQNTKKEDIVNFIINKVSQMKKIDNNSLNGETHLASVGVDSLAAVLMCGYIEEAYNIEVEPILMFEYKTANDVADAVLKIIEEQS